jgi:glycosyltransferase involved in cell wall biosynthesis
VSFLRGHVGRFLLYKVILPRADLVFVQSDRMRDNVAAQGVPAERMVPVPMGVSKQVLASLEGRRHGNVVGPSVLYLGTTIRMRQLETIVKAFRSVVDALPNATLYFVGGENEADIEFLRSEARALELEERVVFTGPLARDEAFSYVRAADVCLSPFRPHPVLDVASPTKLVEYMSFAKPVVVNEHPEQAQVVSASGCGLVVPWDAGRFAAAMIELLGDPARAAAMGQKGRAYVERQRSYEVIAAQVERAYSARLGA